MALTKHDDYACLRAKRDPEFARRIHQRAIELLDGDEEDRRIARRILQNQLGIAVSEIDARDERNALPAQPP